MPGITPISLSPVIGCRAAGQHIPPPPYAVFSADGINVLTAIIGLSYGQGNGPSMDSIPFSLLGLGLSPAAGNITITPDSAFTADFEIFNPNTSAYTSTAFNIAYTGGAITLPGFKIRLKAGLTVANYVGSLTITAPNTTPSVLTAHGSVSFVVNAIVQAVIDRLAILGLTPLSQPFIIKLSNAWDYADANSLTPEYDVFGFMCYEELAQCVVPMIHSGGRDFELNGTLAFDPALGVKSDGSSYVNAKWTPGIDGVKFTLNSAGMGAYSAEDKIGNMVIMGCQMAGQVCYLYPRFGDGRFYQALNSAGDAGTLVPDTIGLFVAQRNSNLQLEFIKDGVSLDTVVNASTALNNQELYFLCFNNSIVPATFWNGYGSIFFMRSKNVDPAKENTFINMLLA